MSDADPAVLAEFEAIKLETEEITRLLAEVIERPCPGCVRAIQAKIVALRQRAKVLGNDLRKRVEP